MPYIIEENEQGTFDVYSIRKRGSQNKHQVQKTKVATYKTKGEAKHDVSTRDKMVDLVLKKLVHGMSMGHPT